MDRHRAPKDANAPDVALKPLPPAWMLEYSDWYKGRFKSEPPAVSEEADPPGARFAVTMGYHMHTRPSQCLPACLLRARDTIPKEHYYKARFTNEEGLSRTFTPRSDIMDILEEPDLLRFGRKVRVAVEGGPNPEWRRAAGWAFANVLGDPSFDLGLNSELAQEKWAALERIMSRVGLHRPPA
jgi:hypothetical protein